MQQVVSNWRLSLSWDSVTPGGSYVYERAKNRFSTPLQTALENAPISGPNFLDLIGHVSYKEFCIDTITIPFGGCLKHELMFRFHTVVYGTLPDAKSLHR